MFSGTGADVVSKSDTSPPTLADLLRELATELATLLRQELTLPRTEVSQSLAQFLSSLGALVTGFALLYAGFLLLLAAAVFSLAAVVPVWLLRMHRLPHAASTETGSLLRLLFVRHSCLSPDADRAPLLWGARELTRRPLTYGSARLGCPR